MPLENLQQFLDEYNARSAEPGFDPDRFNQDFQRGLNTTGINRTQPENAIGKGFLRETTEAVAGGFSDAAEMWMRAIRTVDPEGGNDVIRDFATSGLDAIKNFVSRHPSLAPDANVAEGVKRWWVEGVRAFVPSLSAALPGIAGGVIVGGPVGAVVGSTFGGAIFGLAEFDRFKEEVEDFITDNELSEEDAAKLREQGASKAIYSAITEGGLEGAANALEIMSLGLFRPVRRTLTGVVKRPIRELFKKSAGQIAKEAAIRLPRTAAIEVGTEVTQEALETKFRRDIGLTDLSSIDAAMSVIGPSLVTTLLFLGAAGGANSFQRYSIRKSLEEAKANPNKRKQAVKEISEIVRATGQPDSGAIADQILASGNRFVDEGISIDLNTQVGVQNSLGEIIKGLRLGEINIENTQKYERKLGEALQSEELTGAERIKSTQLLQGISTINRSFEAQAPAKKPKVKKIPATAADKLRDLGDAATTKGKSPVVREEVEEEVEPSEALEELAEEVTEPVTEVIPVEEPEAGEIRVEREIEVQAPTPEEEIIRRLEEEPETVTEEEIETLAEEEIVPTEEAITEAQEGLAEIKTDIDEAAQEAATSIVNDEPQPTQEQIEAGNYKKGHVAIQGLDISIENPKGSERSGFTAEGEPWTTIAVHHYGYIKGTVGRDKDHLDAYIGDSPESENVFVINQVDPDTGKFDEHKVMIGFNTAEEAETGYLANYEEGWQGLGSMIPMSMDEFKTWIKGDTTKELTEVPAPIVEEKPVPTKAEVITEEEPRFRKLKPKVSPKPVEIGPTPENSQKLGLSVFDKLSEGKEFTKAELIAEGDKIFGGTRGEGTYTSKDAFDAMEIGINKFIATKGYVHAKIPVPLEKAIKNEKEITETISNKIASQQGLRSEEQEEFQQFSTPPEIAHAMAYLAKLSDGDVVLEPSAGTGGIAAFAQVPGVKTILNELSERRANLLKTLNFGQVFQENAEQLDNILPENIKPTVILTNPPFSATAGRIKGQRKSANVLRHLEQDLARLEPQGRMVALIGEGFFGQSDKIKNWLNNLKKKGHSLTATIFIDGKKYKKYGTTFGIRMLVIDKDVKQIINPRDIRIGPNEPIISNELEVIRNDRQGELREVGPAVEPKPVEPTSGEIVEEGGKPGVVVSGSERPVHIPTDVVGPKEWDDTIGRKPGTDVGKRSNLPVVPVEPEEGTQLSDEERGRSRDDIITGPKAGERSAGRSAEIAGRTGRPAEGRLGDREGGVPERAGEVEVEVEATIEPFEEASVEVVSEEAKKNREELSDKIFEDYVPQKLKIEGAQKHPTPLVQSAAMAAIEPPNPTYSPNLPKRLVTSGNLSRAQLETIVYAGQAHEQKLADGKRKGFFVGDGPGVGKGRTIAGVIMDNMNRGRKKAIWISANGSLVNDAIRDWKAIGGDPKLIMDLSKIKIDQSIKGDKGLLFTTFSTLSSGRRVEATGDKTGAKPDVKNRMEQILNWIGKEFDGAIVYDEAHQAANSLPQEGARGKKAAALRGLAAVDFQNEIPDARLLYSSATGATEVAHFAYAERLGLWGEGTAFPNKQKFISEIKASGIAGMEVIARDMKAQGVYMARSLSYDGVSYDRLVHNLTKDQTRIFDTLADAWQVILQNLGAALEMTGATKKGAGRARANAMAQFWGAELRFFNQVVLSMQMPAVITNVEQQIKEGNAVVIQLVNTNESLQERQLAKMAAEGEEDFVDLTPKQNMMQYLEKAFPTQQMEVYEDDNGNKRSRPVFTVGGEPVQNRGAVELKEKMLDEIGSDRVKVPEGPLEQIINTFGHNKVAEVTGRKRRQVKIGDKPVTQPRSRARAEREVDAFMNDKLQILVFSDAGGTGRSYHSDKGVKNQRRRIHYVLQPGFKADAAVQGMGRTHRSNQANAPHYFLVTTNVEGQKRFLSKIASRLDQLGALTKGQRQTGSQGLFNAKDNLESQYSRDALTNFFTDLYDNKVTAMNFETVTKALGLTNLIGENGELQMNNLPNINRFLNRILALPIGFQNQIFTAFHNRLSHIIDRAIANGTFETGMQNFKAFSITINEAQTVYKKEGIETKYIQFEAKHKVAFTTFEEAKERTKFKGFYKNKRSGHVWAVYGFGTRTLKNGEVIDEVLYESPVKSNYRVEDERNFNEKNWDKVDDKEAKTWWEDHKDKHKGFRSEKIHLISGALLPIWDRLPATGETTVPMKVIRIQTDEGERFIGRQISSGQVQSTLANLGASVNAQQFEISDVVSQITDSKAVAKLANGWRIRTARVGGEERIELVGNDVYTAIEELKRNGVFVERIQFDTRFFIPSGEGAQQVIENITKNRPIVDVLLPQSPSLQSYNLAKKNIRDSFGSVSMGVDPTVMKDMAVVGTYHLKRGLKRFVDWSRVMLNDLGGRAKQYLRKVWRNVRMQKDVIDNETALDNEATALSKEERPDKEMQKTRIEAKTSNTGIADIDDIINKFTTHNPYNVLHNEESKDRIDKLFAGAKSEDIGFWTRVSSLPWWKAKKFKEWERALGIEIKRSEDKNLLKLEFGSKVFDKGGKDKQHELFALGDKSADKVTQIIYEGDARNIEFTNKELIEGVEFEELGIQYDNLKDKKVALNNEEIKAYRAFQVSMRKSRKKVVAVMEELIYKPYQGKVWLDDLKKLVRDKEEARFKYNADMGLVEDREEVSAENEISEDDIPKNLNDADRTAFINAFIRVFKPQINIENLRRRMGKIKGYAPRIRPEGTYKIDIYDEDGKKTWSEIVKNERLGKRRARELIAIEQGRGKTIDEDFTIDVKNIKKTPEFLYQQVSTIAIERFMTKALNRLESKENITQEELDSFRESMTEALADELKQRGFGAHMMKRRRGRAIGGYQITGGKKIFAGYVGGMAGFITKQKAAYEHGQLLSTIDVSKNPKLYEEITTYSRNLLRNQTRADLISSQVRTAAFMWYLSGQLKSPAVNFTQNWILGVPTLGKFTTGARRKYNKAFFDVARRNFNDEETAALKEAAERGITGDQLMQDIFGETLTQAGKSYRTVLRILSWPFSASEIYNRKAAFLARFRAGIKKGESRKQAFDGARKFVFDVHFLYGKSNQAIIASGGTTFSNVVRTSLTFRNYTFNYLNALKHHIGDANLILVGRSLAYLMLLGGLSSLPFLDDWLDMLERFTGVSIRRQIQKELKSVGGDVLAEVGTFGLPALVGVDLSGSLRIKFPDVTDPSRLFQETAFGVYGGLATKGLDATKAFVDGELLRAFEFGAPVFVEKPLKGLRLLKEGALTKSGKTIFTGKGRPLEVSEREALTQALGFRPSRLAFESGKFREFTNVESFFRNRRASLFRKLRFAKTSKDRREVLGAIREYNQDARKQRGAVPLITAESLRRTQKEIPSKRFRAFSRS